jgi:peroxiredoxin
MSTLAIGDPAPDAAFADPSGDSLRLSTFWRAAPTVLIFLRHFG